VKAPVEQLASQESVPQSAVPRRAGRRAPQLCVNGLKAHQEKQCAPTTVDFYKCGTKL
jgi:hypothetical protein